MSAPIEAGHVYVFTFRDGTVCEYRVVSIIGDALVLAHTDAQQLGQWLLVSRRGVAHVGAVVR